MKFGWTGRDSGGSDRIDLGLIAEMRAYWDALRDGEMLPRRDKVDPRGIANALEHSFLLERIAPGVARFRIAGMVFNDLMGMDIRGMPLSCLFMGDARDRLQIDLERVFRAPCILTLDLLAERSLGRPNLRGRMQILPMLGSQDDSNLAIGCLELGGEIGRAPRRLTITGNQMEQIRSGDAIMAQDKERHGKVAAPIAPRPPRAIPGIPHLRLIKA